VALTRGERAGILEGMTVTLNPLVENFVSEMMERWGVDSPDEAVNRILAVHLADDVLVREAPEVTEEEFVEKMLHAVRAPHHIYQPGDARKWVDRRIAELGDK
jgi:hypothetical protein